MAKRAESLVRRVDPDLTLPVYMSDEKPVGLEAVQEYVIPPRIKIVQKQADDALLERFNAGDVIVIPAEVIISKYEKENPERFHFVPLFFYPEWATWSSIEVRNEVPMILERTLDSDSEIAKKSKSSKLRVEKMQYEGREIEVRHVEHLNFIISLYNHPLGVDAMVLSFNRGEHGSGMRFSSLIKLRGSSIYGGVYEGVIAKRTGPKGEWMGLNVSNPTIEGVNPWVTQDEYAALAIKHKELAESHKAGLLRADYEDTASEDDPSETPASF